MIILLILSTYSSIIILKILKYFRLVLAARDLKAGETLLVEEPLARFPPFYTKPLCLGCYSFIDKNNHINCPECNFPMCSIECCQYPDHLLECSMFKSCKVKVQAEKFNYDTAEVLYDVITPLRILAYKKTNKEKYEEYMDLMDHIDDFRNRVGYLESHQPVVGRYYLRFFITYHSFLIFILTHIFSHFSNYLSFQIIYRKL